jgi:hypothetical protein
MVISALALPLAVWIWIKRSVRKRNQEISSRIGKPGPARSERRT